MDIYRVIITESAKEDLKKVPLHIIRKLQSFIECVENDGLGEVRKVPGYHDEPLKGKRVGQRSIRLSKAYRAIYVIDKAGVPVIIKIVEVNKHDY